ncbi:MAG: hypothetical protein M1825_000683 [Sarcosagium campestre]|nr:MAG: hypothetical protein M1825_000683 [Sarcosagium campestre]
MVSNHTLPRWFLVKSLALALILSIARLALAAPVNQTEGARISIRAQDNYFERYASSCIPFKYRIGEPRPRSMPSVRTCGKHLGNPPSDRLIFFTGGTSPLARTFAEVNGLSTIYDADIDIDGWFVGTAGPAARAMQREAAGEQHWGQDEHYWFTGIMSEAIASKARGRVIVSVPAVYDTTAREKSPSAPQFRAAKACAIMATASATAGLQGSLTTIFTPPPECAKLNDRSSVYSISLSTIGISFSALKHMYFHHPECLPSTNGGNLLDAAIQYTSPAVCPSGSNACNLSQRNRLRRSVRERITSWNSETDLFSVRASTIKSDERIEFCCIAGYTCGSELENGCTSIITTPVTVVMSGNGSELVTSIVGPDVASPTVHAVLNQIRYRRDDTSFLPSTQSSPYDDPAPVAAATLPTSSSTATPSAGGNSLTNNNSKTKTIVLATVLPILSLALLILLFFLGKRWWNRRKLARKERGIGQSNEETPQHSDANGRFEKAELDASMLNNNNPGVSQNGTLAQPTPLELESTASDNAIAAASVPAEIGSNERVEISSNNDIVRHAPPAGGPNSDSGTHEIDSNHLKEAPSDARADVIPPTSSTGHEPLVSSKAGPVPLHL